MSHFLVFVFSLFQKLDSMAGNLDRLFYCLSRNPDRLSEFSVTLPNIQDRLDFRSGLLGLSLAIMKKLKKGGGNPNVYFFTFYLIRLWLGCIPKIRITVAGGSVLAYGAQPPAML